MARNPDEALDLLDQFISNHWSSPLHHPSNATGSELASTLDRFGGLSNLVSVQDHFVDTAVALEHVFNSDPKGTRLTLLQIFSPTEDFSQQFWNGKFVEDETIQQRKKRLRELEPEALIFLAAAFAQDGPIPILNHPHFEFLAKKTGDLVYKYPNVQEWLVGGEVATIVASIERNAEFMEDKEACEGFCRGKLMKAV